MNQVNELEREILTGKVLKILFPRTIAENDTGFRIFIIHSKQGEFCVKGIMPDLETGMTISCDGIWELHKQHGRQFKAFGIKELLPTNLSAIKEYLVKLKIGIGQKKAEQMVDAFKTDIYEVLDSCPEKLLDLKGFKGKTYSKIIDGWSEKRASHAIMSFLSQHGVAASMAHKVYKHMGGEAMTSEGIINRLKANPYLISEIRGIGFKTADKMAMELGISLTSHQRTCSGLIHVLKEASGNNGHTILPFEIALKSTADLICQPIKETENRLRQSIKESTYVELFVQNNKEYLALTKLRRASERIAKELGRIYSFGTPLLHKNSTLLNGPFSTKNGLVVLDESQAAAVKIACTNPIAIITGRPGTGKTSSLRAIIDIANSLGKTIKCCAPTGLASVRLSESTGINATTIHRLLGISQGGKTKEKIEVDLLVIDEISMVGVFLMADLLEALPSSVSILIVGDVDQLPSVEAGNVLSDLIKSKIFPVARLTKIHRQSGGDGKGNGIVEGAHAVIEGKMPVFNDTDFRFIEQTDANKAASWVPVIMSRMFESGTPYEQIQVLSPMRENGPLSVVNLNQVIQASLNPHDEDKVEINYRGTFFRTGDRIRQTKNKYLLGIVNGDIGYIKVIDIQDDNIIIGFTGEREVVLSKSEFEDIVLNFCGTIHSSQGSEFLKLIVAIHEDHYVMLNRNLLYTAITRAKEQCVIVGSKRALLIAIKTQSNAIRFTDLVYILQNEFPIAA